MSLGLIIVLVAVAASGSDVAQVNKTVRDASALVASRGVTEGSDSAVTADPRAIGEVELMSRSENRALRMKALVTLANLGSTNAVVELVRHLEGPEPMQRTRARRELERHCVAPSLIARLLPALGLRIPAQTGHRIRFDSGQQSGGYRTLNLI